MTTKLRRVISALFGAVLLGLSFSVSAAASPEGSEEPFPNAEAWIDPLTAELNIRADLDPSEIEYGVAPPIYQPTNVSEIITAGDCQYRHGVDYPHVHGGEVSVHGWWVDVNGKCGETAKVQSRLQAWGCWNGTVCSWRTVVTGPQADIRSGSGGHWSNARNACASTSQVSWRGMTDVDIHWIIDPFGWYVSPVRLLNCYPSN